MKLINQFEPMLVEKRGVSTCKEVLHFEELSAVVYILNSTKLTAKGFSGRRTKSDFHYIFNSELSMSKHIEKWKERLQYWKDRKEEEAKKNREYKHDFKVGDILYTSWGYDQTNVEFFEVIDIVSDKSIKIREIAKARCDDENDQVRPCKGSFIDKPITKRVSIYDSVKISKCQTASRLTYNSVYCTPLGWGH